MNLQQTKYKVIGNPVRNEALEVAHCNRTYADYQKIVLFRIIDRQQSRIVSWGMHLIIWTRIFEDHIIGPYFLVGTLNGEMNMDFSNKAINSTLTTMNWVTRPLSYLKLKFATKWGSSALRDACEELSGLPVHRIYLRWTFLWRHLNTKVYATHSKILQKLSLTLKYGCGVFDP